MKPTDLTEQLGRWSAGRGPLHVLLAARLRLLIDDGDLPPGTGLPPDRALATALAVGRSTVVAAYDSLRLEGRIARRQGSGTRVAGSPPASAHETTRAPIFLHLLEPRDDVILLACAAPDSPPPELVEAYTRALSELSAMTGEIGYYPFGHPALRHAIAEHYTRRRLPTGPDQVLITNGAQQALSLLARAFLQPGDQVLVEAPTYPGALEAFREEAAVLRPLPVGLSGFEAAASGRRVALAYVVPTFHNPTGSVLPPLPRQRLAMIAAQAGVPLIEDEVLSDLAFPGERTPPPLAIHEDTVMSIGSLSKTVWGGLRIGWVRGPVPVMARLARLRAVSDIGGNIPAQLAAAHLVPQLELLCGRSAAGRQVRHDHLRTELARHLPGWDAPPVRGGQTLWIRLPYGDGTSFAQAALRHRVAVLPGSGLDASGRSEEYVRIHFLSTPGDLSEAVRRLAEAWRTYDPSVKDVAPQNAIAV